MLPNARPRPASRLVPAVFALVSTPALAAWPEDVSIVAMDDYQGVSTVPLSADDFVANGYHTLVQEMGVAIANKPMAPGETLGVYGFQVGVATTFAFIRTGTLDGANPTGWDLANTDEAPPTYLFIPWLQMRKGLPLSIEVGANAGWIGLSETGVLGGYGRWALLEGYRQVPDLTIQAGYSGYVGNDELELGVMDMSATLGYSLPFGATAGIHQSVFSPYFGIGVNRIHAAPRADLSDTQLEERITEISGFRSAEPGVFDQTLAPLALGGGFRLVSGEFSLTLAGTYSPGIIATVSGGVGFVY